MSQGVIVLLSKVRDEAHRIAHFANLHDLNHLLDRHNKAIEYFPTRSDELTERLDKYWCARRNGADSFDFHKSKGWAKIRVRYLTAADCHIITYAMIHNLTVVTEESRRAFDRKDFKKIPVICDMENIDFINVIQLLKWLKIGARFFDQHPTRRQAKFPTGMQRKTNKRKCN